VAGEFYILLQYQSLNRNQKDLFLINRIGDNLRIAGIFRPISITAPSLQSHVPIPSSARFLWFVTARPRPRDLRLAPYLAKKSTRTKTGLQRLENNRFATKIVATKQRVAGPRPTPS
jgi:hypothetical protein